MIKIIEPLQLLGNHGELIEVTVTNYYYEYPINSPTIVYQCDLDLRKFGTNNSPTCVLCKEVGDPENPFLTGAIRTRNPQTNRLAWMHGHCFEIEWEELNQDQKDRYELIIEL